MVRCSALKSELIGIRNGVELYGPVPENDAEERELELRTERFANFLADLILKHYAKIKQSLEEENL